MVPPTGAGVNHAGCIIRPFPARTRLGTMEAERINQLASLLSDLEARSAELRRYL